MDYTCPECGIKCWDSLVGFTTGCEHYPPNQGAQENLGLIQLLGRRGMNQRKVVRREVEVQCKHCSHKELAAFPDVTFTVERRVFCERCRLPTNHTKLPEKKERPEHDREEEVFYNPGGKQDE